MEIISPNLFTFDESTWLWLDRYGIIVGDLLMTFTFLATIYGFICRNKLRNWFKRNQFPSIGGQLEHSHWQGIIFTVSRKEVPLWVIKKINDIPRRRYDQCTWHIFNLTHEQCLYHKPTKA